MFALLKARRAERARKAAAAIAYDAAVAAAYAEFTVHERAAAACLQAAWEEAMAAMRVQMEPAHVALSAAIALAELTYGGGDRTLEG